MPSCALVAGLIVLLLSAAAALVPIAQFLRVLPEIATLYNHDLVPGWRMYLMITGFAILMVLEAAGLCQVEPTPAQEQAVMQVERNKPRETGAMNNPRMNLMKEIERTAGLGMDFIDLTIEAPAATPDGHDWQVVRAAIADAGLEVVAHAAPYLPIHNASPLVRQAAIDELRRCIDVAQQLGAPFCTTHFLGWPGFLDEDQGYEFYRQAYTILIKHGDERGVAVTLENSPHNRHQLKYFRRSSSACRN